MEQMTSDLAFLHHQIGSRPHDKSHTTVLSIVIVSYECAPLLRRCLKSVIASDIGERYEIVVVDNASTDQTIFMVGREFPAVKLIPAPQNLGFASGCNLAAEHAAGELLLLLNPDAVVFRDSIRKLLQFARTFPRAGIWGGVPLGRDGDLTGPTCRPFPGLTSLVVLVLGLSRAFRWRRVLRGGSAEAGVEQEAIRSDVVGGFFFLIRRDMWKALGGFDPIYFMYSEEEDLCLRAARLGARPVVTPLARIFHESGGTHLVRAERLVMLLKGKCTYMRKHWPRWKAVLGSALLCLWPLTRWLAFAVAGRVTSDAGRLTAAKTWREVWNRRTEWLQGWPDPERRSATS